MKHHTAVRHYLDWAATAIPETNPPGEEKCIYGNPSSPYLEGRLAKEALEGARERCARVLGVTPSTLYFTSGGTESNALVLYSLLLRKGGGRLLYPDIEHPSVRENCQRLKTLGILTGKIKTEKDGRVTEDGFSRALEKYPDARFAAVMGVNNETGSRMDIPALVSLARENQSKKGAPVHFHSDLVQALGKVALDLSHWDVDSASFSAHKLGGPRGIGLLYLKKPLEPLYSGGGQERGLRPGTENVPGALAFAEVLERRALPETVAVEEEKARGRCGYLIERLKKINRCALIPADREACDPRFSPWIVQARLGGLPGAVMVRALDDMGVAISTGSACSSNSPERPVLAAMGVDAAAALQGFRISQGWSTGTADFDALLLGIEKALLSL